MEEIWKDIPGYEGRYQASTFGRIRNYVTGLILSQRSYKTRGIKYYKRCAFDRKGFFVHRLIALTFISNLENKPQVDHIDYDEQNNSVDNLRWATFQENQAHSAGRRRNKNTGAGHYRSVLTNEQWIEAKLLSSLGITYSKTARRFGVRPNLLHAMLYREKKYANRPKIIGET